MKNWAILINGVKEFPKDAIHTFNSDSYLTANTYARSYCFKNNIRSYKVVETDNAYKYCYMFGEWKLIKNRFDDDIFDDEVLKEDTNINDIHISKKIRKRNKEARFKRKK